MASSGEAGESFVTITSLVQRCASNALSQSRPFSPNARRDAALLVRDSGDDCEGGVGGGGARGGNGDDREGGAPGANFPSGFNKRETSTASSWSKTVKNDCGAGGESERGKEPPSSVQPTPLDLQDAMTALELGDGRMDCCEILPVREFDPLTHDTTGGRGRDHSFVSEQPSLDTLDRATFPPRIAPASLNEGTPCASVTTANCELLPIAYTDDLPADTLLLPSSPCPSLLPHWDGLRLSSASLIPLLLLQLIALEAYIGSDKGGSNAAETLYCVTWCHDGVLADMAERLGANVCGDVDSLVRGLEKMTESLDCGDDIVNGHGSNELHEVNDELAVAQWALFASTLGAVRIAEAVRLVVLNADFYEEEDFGVALHGHGEKPALDEKTEEVGFMMDKKGCCEIMGDDGVSLTVDTSTITKEDSSMRFCPALAGSQYTEVVWDAALLRLRLHRESRAEKNCGGSEAHDQDSTIDVAEAIVRMQQSLFQAIKILSNLNNETVREFTTIAAKRSREAASLLEELCDRPAVVAVSKEGLVGVDGQVLRWDDPLLSASFDPFLNRRLLGSAPVRRACFCTRPCDAIASLSRLASELEWGVCDLILKGDTIGRVMTILQNNSLKGCGGAVPLANAPTGMNILSRSLIVLNLYFDDKLLGQHNFSDLIGHHMRQQCAAPELLLSMACSDGTAWLARLAKPMYDSLKALCLNRHRERGFIESVLLPAFRLLQYEAAAVDNKFREEHGLDAGMTPSYATNYVILNTIRLMERHIGLGIEMGLYPNWYDLSTTLWYRDFLLSALINVRGSIEHERAQRREMGLCIKMEQQEEERRVRAAQSQQLQQKVKKRGKGKRGKKRRDAHALLAELNAKSVEEDFEDRLDYTSLLLRRNLCRGLVRYIAALRQADLLRDPPLSVTMFTTHQKRFEKRFQPYGDFAQPPHLSHEDYVRGSDFSAVQAKDLMASAADCFRSGKGVVDWMLDVIVAEDHADANKRSDKDPFISIRRDEIMAMAKVVVTNSLFLHKLMSSMNAEVERGGMILLEFKAHKQFCTFRI